MCGPTLLCHLKTHKSDPNPDKAWIILVQVIILEDFKTSFNQYHQVPIMASLWEILLCPFDVPVEWGWLVLLKRVQLYSGNEHGAQTNNEDKTPCINVLTMTTIISSH